MCLRSVGVRLRQSRAVKMTRLLCFLLLIPVSFAFPSSISRPCYVNDYKCIGGWLAANSFCNPNVIGAVPTNYTIPEFFFETSYFNSSYVDTNLSISNHHKCYVSEFFFNLANANSVLAIRCPGLIFQSTRALIQHNVEREDTIYNYDYNGTYPEVIVTVNLRPSNAINLCTSSAFAYVSALPQFDVNANDEKTDQFLSTDLSYLNIYERETFFYRANELIRFFVNSMICNFGCDF